MIEIGTIMATLGLWMLSIIYVEAMVELLIESKIFSSVRNFAHSREGFLSELFSCGYCLSVWISATVAWILPVGTEYAVINFIIALLVLHRLSNVFHEFVARWLNRMPWTVQLNKTEHVVLTENNDAK